MSSLKEKVTLHPFDASRFEVQPNFIFELAAFYASIYNGKPWNEDWTTTSACAEIEEVSKISGFKGLACLQGTKLVGFTWGYDLPVANTDRVNFEDISNTLIGEGVNPKDCFYGADTGVSSNLRGQGLGTHLLEKRTELHPERPNLVFRTKNPRMVDVYRKLFGNERFSFPEESSYPGGRVYFFDGKRN